MFSSAPAVTKLVGNKATKNRLQKLKCRHIRENIDRIISDIIYSTGEDCVHVTRDKKQPEWCLDQSEADSHSLNICCST